ncbi:hypothetical protein F4777DRAFT_579602 [Nemania sp. FL0916]|nr:hypothetical protein F4777DRAFT_579602 [Nemania sp. FL0916]
MSSTMGNLVRRLTGSKKDDEATKKERLDRLQKIRQKALDANQAGDEKELEYQAHKYQKEVEKQKKQDEKQQKKEERQEERERAKSVEERRRQDRISAILNH